MSAMASTGAEGARALTDAAGEPEPVPVGDILPPRGGSVPAARGAASTTRRCWPTTKATRPVHYYPVADADEVRPEKIDALLAGRYEFNGESHLPWPTRCRGWTTRAATSSGTSCCTSSTTRSAWAWPSSAARDARYLQRWVALIDGWMRVTPPGFIAADVTGRRVQNWIYSLHLFVGHAAHPTGALLPAGFHRRLLHALHVQVEFLCANLTPKRNHRTLELYAIFLAGVVFPEMRRSAHWRSFALRETVANLCTDLLPDGVHCELSTDYHHLVLKNALNFRRLATLERPGGARQTSMRRWNAAWNSACTCTSPTASCPACRTATRAATSICCARAPRCSTAPTCAGSPVAAVEGDATVRTRGALSPTAATASCAAIGARPWPAASATRTTSCSTAARSARGQPRPLRLPELRAGSARPLARRRPRPLHLQRGRRHQLARALPWHGGAQHGRCRRPPADALPAQGHTARHPPCQRQRAPQDRRAGAGRPAARTPPRHRSSTCCTGRRAATTTTRCTSAASSSSTVRTGSSATALRAPSAHDYLLNFQLGAEAEGQTTMTARRRGAAPATARGCCCCSPPAVGQRPELIEPSWVSSRYGEKRAAPAFRTHATGCDADFDTVLLPWQRSGAGGRGGDAIDVEAEGTVSGPQRQALRIRLAGRRANGHRPLVPQSRARWHDHWSIGGVAFHGRWVCWREDEQGRLCWAASDAGGVLTRCGQPACLCGRCLHEARSHRAG